MMTFLYQYLLFMAEVFTLVVAIVILLSLLLNLRKKGAANGQLIVKDISEQYQQVQQQMLSSTLDNAARKIWQKQFKQQQKQRKKQQKVRLKQTQISSDAADKTSAMQSKKCLFVLTFNGSTDAHEVDALRREVTAVLAVAQPHDQVIVKLESPGGVVHGYGLAASQLMRIRQKTIPLTVVVDKVAASGGYMMACTANRIIAAPFAIIGSIGVVAQLPNFHRLLKNNDIDVELQTAGEYKRTITMFGENTAEGRAKFKQELEETHQLFKQFVQTNRPQLNIEDVATGEHWFALQAYDKGLVDEIGTSDDFILSQIDEYKVVAVQFRQHKPLTQRFSNQLISTLERLFFRYQGVK